MVNIVETRGVVEAKGERMIGNYKNHLDILNNLIKTL